MIPRPFPTLFAMLGCIAAVLVPALAPNPFVDEAQATATCDPDAAMSYPDIVAPFTYQAKVPYYCTGDLQVVKIQICWSKSRQGMNLWYPWGKCVNRVAGPTWSGLFYSSKKVCKNPKKRLADIRIEWRLFVKAQGGVGTHGSWTVGEDSMAPC